MRWLNFMQRKAAPMSPIALVTPQEPERDPLEEMQTAITLHQSRLNAMATEAERLESQLGRIAALSSQLKVRCSEHDAGAPAQLDALEQEKIAIERQQEGLRLRISSLQSELGPMTREASVLAAERDQQRQNHVVKEAAARCDELIASILEEWEAACADAHELMTLLGAHDRTALDEEHKRQIYGLMTTVAERLLAASLAHVNAANEFEFRHSTLFRGLAIIPAKRKDSLRAAG
jgi:hypothetical protein